MISCKWLNRTILLSVIGMLMLTGCGGESKSEKLQKYVDEQKKQPPPPIEPIPTVKPFETFEYMAKSLNNPFVPPVISKPIDTTNQPDTNRKKEMLEAFPLDSLRMVGVLSQNNRVWAIIVAPNETVHRVQAGNYVGQQFGRIDKVEQDKVLITETVPNPEGGWSKRSTELVITEDDDDEQ